MLAAEEPAAELLAKSLRFAPAGQVSETLAWMVVFAHL